MKENKKEKVCMSEMEREGERVGGKCAVPIICESRVQGMVLVVTASPGQQQQ